MLFAFIPLTGASASRRCNRRARIVAAVLAAAVLPCVPAARGDILYWDANGAAAPNPGGGSGTWTSSGPTWWNGVSNQAYNTGAAPHDTIFEAAAGTVTVSGSVTAGSLTFNTNG